MAANLENAKKKKKKSLGIRTKRPNSIEWVDTLSQHIFTKQRRRLVYVLILVGLILGIVGGTSSKIAADGTIQVATESKVAVILYLVGWNVLVVMWIFCAANKSVAPPGERSTVPVVAVALPFILVRIIYSVLAAFLHNRTFSIVSGNAAAYACMALVPEFIVIIFYLVLGWKLQYLESPNPGAVPEISQQNDVELGRRHRHARK